MLPFGTTMLEFVIAGRSVAIVLGETPLAD
jgi:hypothetical protein